jgi:hypothetical protein
MGAHLRNGKDISREEKQRAEIARQLTLARKHQPLQRRGDVPIYYELSDSALERSRLLEQRTINRTVDSGTRPRADHGIGRLIQNGSPFTTGHGDSSLPSQLPGGFPSARIDPLDPSTRSNRETRSVESPFRGEFVEPAGSFPTPSQLHPSRSDPGTRNERGSGDGSQHP